MSSPHRSLSAARAAVRSALADAGIPLGTRLLVAVSGGSDSLALAHAALYVGRRDGYPVASLTIDHGWREGSKSEVEAVAELLAGLGADPALCVTVDSSGDGGPEASARESRYRALASVARELRAVVLLGHTADDQAETVLMRLARGSGARSLAGMAPVGPCPADATITMLRPFLGMRRAELREALASEGVAWIDDPTNELDSRVRAASGEPLTRSRVRHSIMPALEDALGPGVVPSLGRSARMLRADADALDAIAAREAEVILARSDGVSLEELAAQPDAIRTRILRDLALRAGARAGELTAWHIDTLDSLVASRRGGARLDLPGAHAFVRQGRIMFGGGSFTDAKDGNGRD